MVELVGVKFLRTIFFFFFSIDALMRAYRFNEPRKKVKSFGASMQIILKEDYAKSRPALWNKSEKNRVARRTRTSLVEFSRIN